MLASHNSFDILCFLCCPPLIIMLRVPSVECPRTYYICKWQTDLYTPENVDRTPANFYLPTLQLRSSVSPAYHSNANPQTNFCFGKIFTARCTLWGHTSGCPTLCEGSDGFASWSMVRGKCTALLHNTIVKFDTKATWKY